jgi:alcohol dehydrogenase class IV
MRFEFVTARHILFGTKAITVAAPAARQMGKHPLLVTGRNLRRAERLLGGLKKLGLKHASLTVAGEPDLELIRRGVALAREEGCDMVISFGGGSVIDTGKAIAILLANTGDVLDYLEVVGKGEKLRGPAIPFLAIPTTAGTGSEVTQNAVIGVPEARAKVSLRSPHMLPRLALIDPELTFEMPPELTAATGMDALTQLIEPYVCQKANLMSDMFCTEGLQRISRSLLRAYKNGGDKQAREEMCFAAHLGGQALANAGLGAVHGIAGPLGALIKAPHGALCAALLPHTMRANLEALRAVPPEEGEEALRRYDKIATILTGRMSAHAEDGIEWVAELCEEMGIQPLRNWGFTGELVPELIEKALKASSMKANPIALNEEQLKALIEKAQ